MEQDLKWLEETGIDVDAGIGYTGGKDKYLSALSRFYRSFEKNKAAIEEFFNSKDYENYMITVHALKSNAKMIGALNLSRLFETLETAARNRDTAQINKETVQVIVEYSQLISKLKPLADLGEVRAADEITGEEAKIVAGQLLEALDDFDDEASKKLAKKLSGYPFRITQKDMLTKAMGFIDDFMYDDAADLIKEIMPSIEE